MLSGLAEPFCAQVVPTWVLLFDEPDLLLTSPVLHLLLPRDRLTDIGEVLRVYQVCQVVLRRKLRACLAPVFVHAPHQVVGHADIQRATGLVRDDVDVAVFLYCFLLFFRCSEQPALSLSREHSSLS